MPALVIRVPDDLQLAPTPERRFARKDLAWDYPVFQCLGYGLMLMPYNISKRQYTLSQLS